MNDDNDNRRAYHDDDDVDDADHYGRVGLRPRPLHRVVHYWNGLSDSCVNCSTINDFKSKNKVELEVGTGIVVLTVVMIVGLYGVSLCLLMPSMLSIGGFGELGEHKFRHWSSNTMPKPITYFLFFIINLPVIST